MILGKSALGSLLGAAFGMAICVTSLPVRADTDCARREVLDLVQRHFGQEIAHLELIAESATEIRVEGNRVLCAVEARVGWPPVALAQPRYFQLQSVNGGFEVDFGGR